MLQGDKHLQGWIPWVSELLQAIKLSHFALTYLTEKRQAPKLVEFLTFTCLIAIM